MKKQVAGRALFAGTAILSLGMIFQAVDPATVSSQEQEKTVSISASFLKAHGAKIWDVPVEKEMAMKEEVYMAREGETLAGIAANFKGMMEKETDAEALQTLIGANKVQSGPLKARQEIHIPVRADKTIQTVQVFPGFRLWGLGRRFMDKMGVSDVSAAKDSIRKANNIDFIKEENVDLLEKGRKVKIPLADGTLETVTVEASDAFRGYVSYVQANKAYYKPDASAERIAAEVAALNGWDLAKLASGEQEPVDTIVTGLALPIAANEVDMDPLGAGGDRLKFYHVTIERKDGHAERMYRIAQAAAAALDPDGDTKRVLAWDEDIISFQNAGMESSALRKLMREPANVVFSNSAAFEFHESATDAERQKYGPADSLMANIVRALPLLEAGRPAVFGAAGDWYVEGSGPYAQSYPLIHSPRGYIVGASGKFPFFEGHKNDLFVADFTQAGADVCVPQTLLKDKKLEGTSAPTQVMGVFYAKLMEKYGNRLSPEEIIAAVLMTARRDLYEFPADGEGQPKPAIFKTNGGALPYHPRCGAGSMDPDRTVKALDRMVEMKAEMERPGGYFAQIFPLNDAVSVKEKRKDGQYVYRAMLPRNVTLGKMIFVLAQESGQHADVKVRTPAGFEMILPRTITGVVSTMVMAYEDIPTGASIEVSSSQPFAQGAEIIVHGLEDGNIVQKLRDELRANGILPQPLKILDLPAFNR
ncbi:MAG: hypothetical protein HY370_09330 [Proteobacteria bacterium]|nr:hypothetical protein [Pseudomonadota bacterium]